ncbi:zinc finger (ccch type) motif-containing protein [Cyclospora cayetanensis]|uniref:Zinc finger (Ccch type) motif-containing protein n=1 Tax=Cyclospora cayetanensis TaxID=88456 RepID=A0A1D3CQX3_9EIME|nr:zinc finger (ccch type) motif-containing protein [Cyclospora cayetanensis]
MAAAPSFSVPLQGHGKVTPSQATDQSPTCSEASLSVAPVTPTLSFATPPRFVGSCATSGVTRSSRGGPRLVGVPKLQQHSPAVSTPATAPSSSSVAAAQPLGEGGYSTSSSQSIAFGQALRSSPESVRSSPGQSRRRPPVKGGGASHPGSAIVATQMIKTKLCMDNQTRGCVRGSSCPYAHSEQELRALPDLRKTKICAAVLAGKGCLHACSKNKACRYAHSDEELRLTCHFAEYRTRVCR